MVLSIQQSLDLLKKPANRNGILDAHNHEERVKLHTKAVDTREKASTYAFDQFLRWVKDRIKLPDDKYQAFEGMCIFPLPTTSLCSSIFDEYEKIFTAQDAFRDYSLLDDTFKVEFQEYIDKKAKVKQYFERNGLKDLRKQFNCAYVVDMPSMQTTPRPEPYFYKVPISSIIDVNYIKRVDNVYEVSYFIFKKGDTYTAIDENSYKVFRKGKEDSDYVFLFESFHNLGYAPVCFLSINHLYDEEDGSPVALKNPLSDAAGDLDWLLFYKVAERMYETYGPFPIFTVPQTKCDYTDADGQSCSSGMIPYKTQREGLSCYPCPSCSKNSLAGPGTVFGRPTPRTREDAPLAAAVEITPPNIESLDYITKKIDYLEWNIYENAVGASDEEASKEAINEKQVEKSVQGKRNVLREVKKNFEHAEKFIIDTMGKLIYGDYYEDCTINLGEQFLLYTAVEVIDQFTSYKKAGVPNHMINQKKNLLIQTEHRNNPYQRQRSELLELLEPWPDLSLNECIIYQLNLLYPEKFGLKLDFAKFVSKFELINGDIVQWGNLLSVDEKINRLTLILTQNAKAEFSGAKELPAPDTRNSN